MNRQTLVVIALLFLGSVVVMYALSHFALRPQARTNGFSRIFDIGNVITAEDTIDLGFDSYYLAGNTDHTLYLGNLVAPRHVVSFGIPQLDSQHFELKIQEPQPLRISSIQVAIDSPAVFLCEGTAPVIYAGELADSRLSPVDLHGFYFLDVVPSGDFSFVLRILNERRENALAALKLNPFTVKVARIDLEKQIDGFFCTSGKLHYDRKTGDMIYVYTYRNSYIRIDPSLSAKYTGKTIDTTSRADIGVATITSSETRTLSRPSRVVNRLSALHGKFLLINSGLIADNEEIDDFRDSSVIDVYDVRTMRYTGSFYVPNLYGERLRNFVVVNNRFVGLYERNLVVFRMLPLGD